MRTVRISVWMAAVAMIGLGEWFVARHATSDKGSTMEGGLSASRMTDSKLQLTSPVFAPGAPIPAKYSCDGSRFLNPPLLIAGVPQGARSLALIVEDPDVPKVVRADGLFVHWVLFDIPPETHEIPEGVDQLGVEGNNTAGKLGYTGPCPPPQYEPSQHRYFFRLYALDTMLSLQPAASQEEVLAAMEGHVIAETELMGTYQRTAP